MTIEEKKEFRKKHGLTVKTLSALAKILIGLVSAHHKLNEVCCELYQWVKVDKNRKGVVIDLFVVVHGYTVKEATGLVERYLAWGNGSLDEKFFALPLPLQDKLKKFSDENINVVLEDPTIKVVVHDYDNCTYSPTYIKLEDLSKEQFRQVFTYKGRQREEEEQEAKVEKELGNEFTAPINGTVYTKTGVFSFHYYLKKAMQVVAAESNIKKNKQHVAKLTTALKQTKARGKVITDNAKK